MRMRGVEVEVEVTRARATERWRGWIVERVE
jgi:hypothetical protein